MFLFTQSKQTTASNARPDVHTQQQHNHSNRTTTTRTSTSTSRQHRLLVCVDNTCVFIILRTMVHNNNHNHDKKCNDNKDETQTNTWDGDTFIYRGGKIHRSNKQKIKHVIVCHTVIKIDDQAFERCKILETVKFLSSSSSSSSLQEIGNRAFFECSSLRSIVIPPSVQRIGKRAFAFCTKLENPLINDPTSSSSSSSLTLQVIEKQGFYHCEAITEVKFPSTLHILGAMAFGSCRNLTVVEFSKHSTIKAIPYCCFLSCDMLETMILPEGNELKTLSTRCFSGCGNLTSISLPNSLKVIGDWSFSFCESIEYLTIPSSVEEIGSEAFLWCDTMVSVKIPASVQKIQVATFLGCTSLESIELSHNLKTIESRAFCWCKSLSTIVFPQPMSVRREQEDECYCISDENATFALPGTIESIAADAFDDCNILRDLIDWKMIHYICTINKAKSFLKQSTDCPAALRPYVLRPKSFLEMDKAISTTSTTTPRKCPIVKEEICHSSYIFYILVHDGTIWTQQENKKREKREINH